MGYVIVKRMQAKLAVGVLENAIKMVKVGAAGENFCYGIVFSLLQKNVLNQQN